MKLVMAKAMGFCGGVKSLDKKVQKAIQERPGPLYSYGPLVHNEDYVARMEEAGVHVLDSLEDLEKIGAGATVIGRAHGVTRQERAVLEGGDWDFIDGTCPILLQIYKQGQAGNREGRQVVIIGDPNHPEVRAMRTYFDEDTVVLEKPEEADHFEPSRPFLIISQTTIREDYFKDMVRRIEGKGGHEVLPTRCRATRDRQEACAELAKQVDGLLVVGGRNSSNTEKLRQTGSLFCDRVDKVQNSGEIPLQIYSNFNTIGIIAGASTPGWIIEEVVERMENFSKEDFMEKVEDSMVKIYPRDIVKGDILKVKDDEVYVDIHYQADGIIKLDEMTKEEAENPKEHFHEGEEIDVYVIKLDDGEGNVALSTRRVEGLKNWQKLVEKYENDETVDALVVGSNRGGLVVKVMGVSGFIPASHITTYFVKNFKQFVGETLPCKFLSIDERKRRVVLSSRKVKEKELDKVWDSIVVGEQIEGKVVRMTDFGAFVDLGGVDGLIHVSDISWQHVDKPSDVLEIGQKVEPLVLKANRDRNRISLGLKQLTPKPFDVFLANNKAGDVVKGRIVNLVDFGAFVRLKEGVEGLVHVSQIANHHVEKPSDELEMNQELNVKILNIEEDSQRIALSIRALEKPEEKKEEKSYDPSRFERKPQQSRPKKQDKPRRKAKPKQADLSFDSSDDIGTNIGDLIAQQMDLTNEGAGEEAEEAEPAEPEETVDEPETAESESEETEDEE